MLLHNLIYQGEADKIAIYGENAVTYGRLQENVVLFRNYLYKQGVRPGEKVGLLLRNCPAFVYTYMAIVSLGATVVPINYLLTAREVAYIVQDAQITNLVVANSLDLTAPLEKYDINLRQHLVENIVTDTNAITYETAPSFDLDIDEGQSCAIIYTSGTTGYPKGAILTHKNLLSDAVNYTKAMPVYEGDNILCILPLYHCLAWTCIILSGFLHKAAVTIIDSVVPKEIIENIKKFQATVLYGVPPVYMLLLKIAQKEDVTSIRLFMSGGASLPKQVADDFLAKFGIGIVEGYGLSEAAPVVATNPQHKIKYFSIGLAIPNVEVKIVGTDEKELPRGIVGELIVRGPNVMKGYYNLPEETAFALRGGWLHTGDLAYQDEDGYLFIVDRLKDMIITNGENIYPREVEELLYAYPGIAEAAVVGVPDDLRGQAVCAYIVLREGQLLNKKDLKSYLRKNIAAYKIPREFIVLESLPKTSSGKILKRELRELAV